MIENEIICYIVKRRKYQMIGGGMCRLLKSYGTGEGRKHEMIDKKDQKSRGDGRVSKAGRLTRAKSTATQHQLKSSKKNHLDPPNERKTDKHCRG